MSARKYGCWQHHHGPLLVVVQQQLPSCLAALLFAELASEVQSAVPVLAVWEVQPFEQETLMLLLVKQMLAAERDLV